jgi:voltage-gated potassium channel
VAQAVLRPTVVDFIELATKSEHFELQIEESRVAQDSTLVGKSLKDSGLRQEYGVIVVAVKKRTGHMIFNPASHELLQAGDILILIGAREHLDRVSQLAGLTDKNTGENSRA